MVECRCAHHRPRPARRPSPAEHHPRRRPRRRAVAGGAHVLRLRRPQRHRGPHPRSDPWPRLHRAGAARRQRRAPEALGLVVSGAGDRHRRPGWLHHRRRRAAARARTNPGTDRTPSPWPSTPGSSTRRLRFIEKDMFASLRCWTGEEPPPEELHWPSRSRAMDAAHHRGDAGSLVCCPEGALISNEEVAGWVAEAAGAPARPTSVTPRHPMRACGSCATT